MSASTNGVHEPRPASRVLILGYYDGATDGVIELGPGRVYRFDLAGEAHNPDGCDERTFALRPLPADALDRLAAALAPFQVPNWPAWLPVWSFPTDADRDRVNAAVGAVLAEAGERVALLTTADTVRFVTYRPDSSAPLASAG